MSVAQPQLIGVVPNPNDVVYTPDWLAKDIIDHYMPMGFILDPCIGDGAFFRNLPDGSYWCEIAKGRDFYQWNKKVDWIITNPPWSDCFNFMMHAFEVATNIVFLLPMNKLLQSPRYIEAVYKYGGIKELYYLGNGRLCSWGVGFAIGAIHLQRDYKGAINMSFRSAA